MLQSHHQINDKQGLQDETISKFDCFLDEILCNINVGHAWPVALLIAFPMKVAPKNVQNGTRK